MIRFSGEAVRTRLGWHASKIMGRPCLMGGVPVHIRPRKVLSRYWATPEEQ